jgi:hypothetical protein
MSTEEPDEKGKTQFRQQVKDHIYAANKKPFLASTPPNAMINTLLFVLLMIGGWASLFWIKMPVSIQAEGEIKVGAQYFVLTAERDNQTLNHWQAAKGDRVSKEQNIAVLQDRDQRRIERQQLNYSRQLSLLTEQIVSQQQEFQRTKELYVEREVKQQALLLASNTHLKQISEVESLYAVSVSKGLLNQQTLFGQQNLRAAAYADTQRYQAELAEIEIAKHRALKNIDGLIGNLQREFRSIQKNKDDQSGDETIISPCDCELVDILVGKGMPVSKGVAIATLFKQADTMSVQLFFRADAFRPIEVGSTLSVSLSTYPSMKYGTLKGRVTTVTSAAIPGAMFDYSYLLPEQPYFSVTADLLDMQTDVLISSGMRVETKVVVDHQSLFSLLFKWK